VPRHALMRPCAVPRCYDAVDLSHRASERKMELLVTVEEYESDTATQQVWLALAPELEPVEGVAYYRHPILGAAGGPPPDLTVLGRTLQPFAIRALGCSLDAIDAIGPD